MLQWLLPLFVLVSAQAVADAHLDDFSSCREISDKEKQIWNQKAHVDLPTSLHERLRGTHQDIYPKPDFSRFQQAELLVKAFDADTWLDRFRNAEGDKIPQERRTQLEFLFSFWVREKYLGLLARAAAREEQNELKLFGTKIDANIRNQVLKYPAEPRITRISTFHCEGAQDSRSYRCGEPHVVVDVQLSPNLLCGSTHDVANSHLRLIVRLDALRGPLITDVERNSIRIYQDTLLEYLRLKSKLTADQLYSDLRQRAFFSKADFNEIPGSGILSLRENEDPQKRQPASSPTNNPNK